MVRLALAGISQRILPAASVTSGSRAAIHGDPGMTERSRTMTRAPTIGRPDSSRRVATVAIRRPSFTVRRRVPERVILARFDACRPLFGGPTYGADPPVGAAGVPLDPLLE